MTEWKYKWMNERDKTFPEKQNIGSNFKHKRV